MTGYDRQCIPNYATLAQPLTELTRKRRRFDWSSKCQTAFDALKKLWFLTPSDTHVLTCPTSFIQTPATSV